MVTRVSQGAKWFLDTSYALALASRSDAGHEKARALASDIVRNRVALVTSQAVLLEIGNAMAKIPLRMFGVRLLEQIHRDPAIEVVSITDDLYRDAFAAYRSRPDKEWGLIDCMSIVIMQRLGIREALTADHHFEQAGFRALMRPTA